MNSILPLLGVLQTVIIQTEARFDIQEVAPPSDLECPPKCVCSRWSCIDEIDIATMQEQQQSSIFSLSSNDQIDETFRCWKNCCKKQGVQVSTCDRNVCQKCCDGECVDIKSMIRMRRKFASETCNTCLQQHCAFSQEYISVFTTRSCRGLFNKYSTSFNESITFQVEAERDLRIFLYDEPLSLLRNQLRKRRDAEPSDDSDELFSPEFESFLRDQYAKQGNSGDIDILDDPYEDEDIFDDDDSFDDDASFDADSLLILKHVYQRVRRQVDERGEALDKQIDSHRKEEKAALRKTKRISQRLEQKSQKILYGKIQLDGDHVQSQIDALHKNVNEYYDKRDDLKKVQPLMDSVDFRNDPGRKDVVINEAVENFNDDSAQYDFDYRSEPVYEDEVIVDQKAEMKAMRKQWRDDRKRLTDMSETFRRLEAALESSEVRQKALDLSTQVRSNDEGINGWSKPDGSDDGADDVTDDMLLSTILGIYMGKDWNKIAPKKDESEVQTQVKTQIRQIQKNLEETYKETKKQKVEKPTIDTADWRKARAFRGVPEEKVAAEIVKSHVKQLANKETKEALDAALGGKANTQKSISFLQSIWQDPDDDAAGIEEGFTDEESGMHDDMLNGGWIQIGLGSSNNTACDLKSCQSSSLKRCIGVLRKRLPNILSSNSPQEITVSVTGQSTERILTVDIKDKLTQESRRIFEVIIDDPTIAQLKNMAVCTTKGSRGKLSFCCGNEGGKEPMERTSQRQSYPYFTDFRRMVDCQFSCLSSNCRQECMPDTQCDQCLQKNCGAYSMEGATSD